MFMYKDYILNKSYFVKVIENLAEVIEQQKDYLTKLDSEIGDGDHGVNLSIGFREI
ncbi:MAG TPA: dihydroxyacetone kinase, partial [Thermoanaerobacter sp.]|nr:dihydroxyacetone kinase [Thermoanaerobacter sp.]